ncbi:glycosyltransferase family 2 protein [Nocardioides dongkuii]|uniref:glycosyltransferase family 2 protein n=1 Tax=Nocardioides dongkuii TaxID=2760089 RepID=UPI0015FCC384|nr:galactosyltransferase-related protein [Nocardioides dongkuii]
MSPRVAVVTIAHGRHAHLAAQHRSLAAGDRRPDDYVVVAMDDPGIRSCCVEDLRSRVVRVPTDPRGLPLARARNRGVRAALDAGADVVVCLDVDCLAGPGLVASYAERVDARPTTVWQGPVTYLQPHDGDGYPLDRLGELDDPHPARPAPVPGEVELDAAPELFWSLSFALSRTAWERSGGFCPEYVGYGAEDTDFGRTLVARGLTLAWDGAARAYHQHHAVSRPPVEHLDDILRNAATYHRRWGEWPMTGWLEEFERLGIAARRGERWVRTATA